MLQLAFGRGTAARYASPTSQSYATLAEASRYIIRADPFERLLKLHATRCHYPKKSRFPIKEAAL